MTVQDIPRTDDDFFPEAGYGLVVDLAEVRRARGEEPALRDLPGEMLDDLGFPSDANRTGRNSWRIGKPPLVTLW